MELISVILVMGILTVSVFPKLFDRSDVAPVSYQTKLISVLRNLQIRAMQDTRNLGYCFQVNFDNSNHAFGPPELDFIDDEVGHDPADTCTGSIDTSNNLNSYYTTSAELSDDGVSLEARNSNNDEIDYLRFDGLGRPVPELGSCASGCTIDFIGDVTERVCIESQGYVHEGNCD